jgi:catechol 2,3-dioxygenase-like lactoylglutathione lyase family enzyme
VTLPLIDHLALRVPDVRRSRTFYERALEPFGVKVVESSQGPGFAIEGGGDFWIGEGEPPAAPVHVAFAAVDRATVDKFHRARQTSVDRRVDQPGEPSIEAVCEMSPAAQAGGQRGCERLGPLLRTRRPGGHRLHAPEARPPAAEALLLRFLVGELLGTRLGRDGPLVCR